MRITDKEWFKQSLAFPNSDLRDVAVGDEVVVEGPHVKCPDTTKVTKVDGTDVYVDGWNVKFVMKENEIYQSDYMKNNGIEPQLRYLDCPPKLFWHIERGVRGVFLVSKNGA